MAETATGYLPDVLIQWSTAPELATGHRTEVIPIRGGGSQRRSIWPSAGFRRWKADGVNLDASSRQQMAAFLNARRGQAQAFYFFIPFHTPLNDVAGGSASSSTKFTVPFRLTNPNGLVLGTIDDVRVAGQTKNFSLRHLVPRSGRFATLRFNQNASNQYVDCTTGVTLRPTGDMSIAAWVYQATSGAAMSIVDSRTANASGITLGTVGAGDRRLQFITARAGAQDTATSTKALSLDAWTHVAIVRSGTNVTFYFNGVADNTVGSISNPVAATASFRIGANTSAASGWDGMMNDVMFYDTALSAGNIATLALSPSANGGIMPTIPSANLRGWWSLGEGTGITANDLSGTGNPGTLTNSPAWAAGEEEVIFGSAQTGAVTLWGRMRERIIAQSLYDEVTTRFLQAADVQAYFPIAVMEVS